MLVVDPERVNQMDSIVERDDTRIGDITEVKELYNRLDLKLNGTKQHLKNLYDTTVTHMNVYNAKVDSIKKAIPDSHVEVDDLNGGGDHLQVNVVSSAFAGLTLVQQHQLVYKALQSELQTEAIHALSLTTSTPN